MKLANPAAPVEIKTPPVASVGPWYAMMVDDSQDDTARFYLVGPFDSGESLQAWGDANEQEDPGWQGLKLANPSAPVEIRKPNTTATH